MLSYGILDILSRCIVLFSAISVHEFSHGMAAYKLGDPTAKYSGRLTLNPLSHIDPIGAVCMVLFRFGWAKPVPINPMYFRDRKRDTAITAAAGPLSNILLAFLSAVLVALFTAFIQPFSHNAITYFIERLLYECAYLNIYFAAFNLIPLPPLDGSKILGAFLSQENYMRLLNYERFAYPILIICMITGLLSRVLSVIITPLISLWNICANGLISIFVR